MPITSATAGVQTTDVISAGIACTIPSWFRKAGAFITVRYAASVVATVFALAGDVQAEMAGDDYRSEGVIQSPDQRRSLEEEIEQARGREALEETRREALRRAEQQRIAVLDRLRPEGERLTAARCSGCHQELVVDKIRHSRIGWWLVVERMRWWHGARLGSGEAARIVSHLATTRPATALRVILEWVVAAAVLSMPILWLLFRGRTRRR